MGLLRVILALSVVVAHTGPIFGLKLTGGLVAVESFFIISGFYMALILDRKYQGPGGYRLFLSNRFLRLFPIYWVVLGLTVGVSVLTGAVWGHWLMLGPCLDWVHTFSSGTAAFLLGSNLLLFGQDAVVFLGLDAQDGRMFFTENFANTDPRLYQFLLVPQAWTLGIELMFYVIAPLIVRRKIRWIVLVILGSLALRCWIYFSLGLMHDPWTYRFFPTELALFLFGAIAYRFYTAIKDDPRFIRCRLPITGLLFGVILTFQFFPGGWTKVWALYGLVSVAIPFLFHLTKDWKLDQRIGELSYPIYVVHVLVVETAKLIALKIPALDPGPHQGLVLAVISTLAAVILVKLVSDPVEVIRQSRVRSWQGKAVPAR